MAIHIKTGPGQASGKGEKKRPGQYRGRDLSRNGTLIGLAAVVIILFFAFFLLLVPVNLHSIPFWITLIAATTAFPFCRALYFEICGPALRGGKFTILDHGKSLNEMSEATQKLLLIPAALTAILVIALFFGSTAFNASRYASILTVTPTEFTEDLDESVGTSSIALMDTASAKMLGDREIGTLANVVSQYNVSGEYIQIDLNGAPKKVSPLEYAGFFKWIGNKSEGVPGYVIVDPVSMSASYTSCDEGMIYVPSAYLFQDAARYIRFHYPTALIGNLHFEVNEDGAPYYVASVYDMTISFFGGETVKGAIVLDPITGEIAKYDLADVPTWVDMVYEGDLICEQYNWHGTFQNGFWNSLFAKKGCKQVTTYRGGEEDDEAPTSDYGYVAKDGDIWIYTGVTSVNGDSSNIGFLLANERTGESHYYTIAGADEKSAMAAAEGEVQEKGYQASFPSLINVDGRPTYIMVLKDQSGLVKLYAAVNVEQYNLVTTAQNQQECLKKYRAMLGLSTQENLSGDSELVPNDEADIVVAAVRDIVIDGNTWIYLIGEDESLYRAKASDLESLLLVKPDDSLHLVLADDIIVAAEKLK